MSTASALSAQAMIDILSARFGSKITESHVKDKHPRIHCGAENWREIAEFLHDDPRLKLDWMSCLSGADYVADQKFCVVYDLMSFDTRHRLAVKVFVGRDKPVVPSVCDLWPAADWHEREAYDMFGLEFTGHPDLRRILCADDWEGFPLRKDYVFPREYHGIPASVELDWQQQADYPG